MQLTMHRAQLVTVFGGIFRDSTRFQTPRIMQFLRTKEKRPERLLSLQRPKKITKETWSLNKV